MCVCFITSFVGNSLFMNFLYEKVKTYEPSCTCSVLATAELDGSNVLLFDLLIWSQHHQPPSHRLSSNRLAAWLALKEG